VKTARPDSLFCKTSCRHILRSAPAPPPELQAPLWACPALSNYPTLSTRSSSFVKAWPVPS